MSEAHWKGTSTVIFVSPNLKGSHIAELRLDSPFPLRLHDEPPPVTTNPALWATGLPTVIHLHAAAQYTLGRHETANIVLDSRYKQFFVSRQHATLTCMVDRAGVPSFVINDNASLNGVAVNNVRVMSCELRHGDMLSLGGCSHLSVGNFDAQIVSKTDVNYRFVVLGHPSPPRQRKRSATTTAADAAKHSATKARDPSDDKVKSPHKRARTTQNGDDDDLSGSDSIDNVSSNNDSSSSSSSSSDNQSRPMRFAVGAAVEAQSTNALTREVDAWFDATIVSVNARQGMYTVRFDSYGPEFDEKLPAQRVRLRADGEWKYAQIVEGKTRMLVQYRKRQIWYDALVLKKIADPAVVGEKVPCLHVRWLDQPIGAKPAEATTPFDTTMEFAYLPEQTW